MDFKAIRNRDVWSMIWRLTYQGDYTCFIGRRIVQRARTIVITILIFSLNVCYIYGQSVSPQILELRDQIIPFNADVSEVDVSHFVKLKTFIANKQVIALGEATHGTREFFLYKAGLCKYLIKECGVKTIILESDFAGGQHINDFVLNGKGRAEENILKMGFSGTTREFTDFVKWVQIFNKGKEDADKVKLYGCDMQYPVLAIPALKDYLATHQMLNIELSKGLELFNKFLPGLTDDDKTVIRRTVSSLTSIVFADQDPDQRVWYLHSVRYLQQFVEYMDAKSTMFPARQSNLRDKFMAENCEWIYSHNKNQKAVIWAHNEHIKKSKGSDGYVRMGMILRDLFKEDYYGICLDFYKGTMRSYDYSLKKNIPVELPVGKIGSTGEIFSRIPVSAFFLDFKTAAKKDAIYKFLNNKTPSVWYGANFNKNHQPYYVSNKLADAFDAVVFFNQTSAASNINQTQ